MTLLMRTEAEEETELAQVQFENNLFASNFPMWKELYGKRKEKEEAQVEENAEWITSKNQEFDVMLEEIRSLGLDLKA